MWQGISVLQLLVFTRAGENMTPQEIKTLIDSDAAAAASFAAGNDNATAVRLSVIAPMVQRLVPNVDIKRHAILNNYWPAVVIATESTNTVLQVRALAIGVGAWVNDVSATTDFDLPEVQAMMGGLVSAGLMTAEQQTSLIALASVPQVITPDQVSKARAI